jgi:tetratricopeptide (TPR) repeat protein
MPDAPLASLPSAQKQSALLRILKATTTLPAQVTLYASALGAIALAAGAGLPPVLTAVAAGVGVNALSNLLERVARGEPVTEEEILQKVQSAIADSGIDKLLTEEEFQRAVARLHEWQASLACAIDQHEQTLIQRLDEQTRHYTALTVELRASISADLQKLATRGQGEEIIWRLRNLPELIGPRIDQRGQQVGVQYNVVIGGPGQPPRIPLYRPLPASHFTGRKEELARLLIDLQPGRVVTLCGPGGVGKTALAAEAIWILAPGEELPARFPDGLFFHSFYGQPEAALALEAIARAYGEEPRPSPRDAARRVLAGRVALLVLDGAENADDLRAVLEVAGGCGALVTSRRRWDAVVGRQDVAPLPNPEAVQLLQAWGGVRAADEVVARRICELVGGLPLAVRLAGRYLAQREEEAADYISWLEKTPLRALDHGGRQWDSVPLLLERSLAQVSEGARDALAVVGSLALASYGREAVAAALDASPGAAGRTLGELVDYGLLLREEARYQVSHPLVHTYACERLPPPTEAASRLAAYYTTLAEEQSALGLPGYAVLDDERPHVMATLTGCIARDHWEGACNLVWAIEDYLDLQGYWLERVTALDVGLTAARALGRRYDEGVFLGNLGSAYSSLGQVARAIEYHEQALAISRELGEQGLEGAVIGNLGSAYLALGQVERAIEYHEEALAIAREIGDRHGEGNVSDNLGLAYTDLGQVERAIGFYQQALIISREIGDQRGEGNALGTLGSAYSALGQAERAVEYHEQALAIAYKIGDRRMEEIVLGTLGDAYLALGQGARAIEYWEGALAIARQIGDRRGEGNVLGSLGFAYLALGQVERAIEYCHQALAISQKIGDRRGEGERLSDLGNAYAHLGELQRAIEYHQQALSIAREIGDRRGEGTRLGNLGFAYGDLGQVERAIEYCQQALAISRKIGDRCGEGADLGNLGFAYRALGQVEQAIEYHEQALAISRELGDPRGERTHLGSLGSAYYELGQAERAMEYYEGALAISQKIGDRRGEGAVLRDLGQVYRDLGQVERAVEYHEQALAISREIGDRRMEGNALGNLGSAYSDLGQVERAIEYYEQALAISREIGDRRGEGNRLGNLGSAYAALRQPQRAIEYLDQALAIFEEIESPYAEQARRQLAILRNRQSNPRS